jgi:ribosomal protein S18 acetylase RimI-like enzyme
MDVTSLGFRTDLTVLSLGGSTLRQRGDHLVVRTPSNPTFWWGNFVLFAGPVGPGDVPRLLALYAAELPDAAHVGIDTTDGTAGADDELRAAGFHVGRDTVLTATALQQPTHPVAATLRPLEGDDDWRQALELRLSWAEAGVTPAFLTAQVVGARALCERGHATWYGAFEDGILWSSLGLVSAGELARFQVVETRPEARRRGLASALVHHAGQAAFERGVRRLVIVAEPEYHAIGIYRSLGFVAVEQQVQLIRRPAAA